MVAATWLIGMAAWTIYGLLLTFVGRFDYPMDIEWMEGGQLYHGYRVLHGLPLYADCSDGFMAFAYPPVHAWALALVGKLAYLDYAPGRLLSIGSILVVAGVLSTPLWQHARRRGLSVWGAGLFVLFACASMAGSYYFTGHWYDIVRVDSLYLAFLASALVLSFCWLEGDASKWRLSMAVAVWVFAMYAKQTTLFFLPWPALYGLRRDKKRTILLVSLVAVSACVVFGILMYRTDGRFYTYVIQIMGRHPLVFLQAKNNAVKTLLFAPYLLFLPFLAIYLKRRNALSATGVYWLGVGTSALVASWVTAAKVGAYLNNMATIMLFSGVVVSLLCVDLLAVKGPGVQLPRGPATGLATVAGLLLLGYGHAKKPVVPGKVQRDAARKLNTLVAGLKGGVLSPGHTFLPVRNGHRNVQIHEQAYVDYMGSGLERFDVLQCRQQLDAKWLIVSVPTSPYLLRLLAYNYRAYKPLPAGSRTSVGMYTRPAMLLRRKGPALVEKKRLRRRTLFDFESGTYQGFSVQGDAFTAPTRASNGFQQPIAGIRGRYAASSYSRGPFDAGTGRLLSAPFRIDRAKLGFRLGGGRSANLSVELVVDGQVVKRVRTSELLEANLELLLPVSWDVGPFRGKRGRVRIVDDARRGWGHILVDAIELYDEARNSGTGG